MERNLLWVGGVWRSALLGCNHHQHASLWSAWRCGRVFKAGNSTSLMFPNLKNKMPNIRFFPPFFSLQHIPARTDYSIVHCASRPSLLKEGRAAVWGMRGLLLLQGIFLLALFIFFFPLCVRDIKCSGNVQILPAKNGCFHSSPLANFKLIKK